MDKVGLDAYAALLIFSGLALHFLATWGEHWRDTKTNLGPLAYAALDKPGWIFAVVATGISYLVFPQLGPLIGVGPPLGYVAAGYVSSSLGAKLNSFAPKKAP